MLKPVLQYGRYVICLVAFGPGASFAQTSLDAGEIHGVTKGVDKRPVPGVNILVRSVNDSSRRTVSSDGDGTFSVSNLSAGIYELVPSKAGFAEAAKTVVEVWRSGPRSCGSDARRFRAVP